MVTASVLIALVTGAGFLGWRGREQLRAAESQARDFAASVHQMTLAGLTAMMITGNARDRAIFLDQIEQSNHIRSLRVLRSEAVTKQFGSGTARESAPDAVESSVMATGEPHYGIVGARDSVRLRAVLPAIASRSTLGKDCLACHSVPEGTILGAVSMEVSLSAARASVARSNARALGVALALLVPFGLLVWWAAGRLVTRPLRHLTHGLRQVAAGDVSAPAPLPAAPGDEVADATAAFNQVMVRVGSMLQELRLAQTVFDHALEAITVTDADGRIRLVNRSFEVTTGYSSAEVVGGTPAILKSGLHDADFYRAFWLALREKGGWSGEIFNRKKDGTIYPEWLNVVGVRGPTGRIEHYIAIFTDITERKAQEHAIAFKAFHDALTGLPNRDSLKVRLEQAIALAGRKDHPSPSVLYVDLDRFKWVNDNLGHAAGDRVLVEVAARLIASVRDSDTVARIGGDEFVILLPETSSDEGLERVKRKIVRAVEEPILHGGERISVSASIGHARFPGDGKDADSLLGCADQAMYRAKAARRSGAWPRPAEGTVPG